MARRSYGSGSLAIRPDSNGVETWYGWWRVGGRRVYRALGPKRAPGSREGLTRTQAEAELRRRMQEGAVVIARAQRRTMPEAGERYVEHLATVKQRKRTTIEDYRGYLRGHLVPHFGERTLDRIESEHIEAYMHAKLATLSPKTVTNHLSFMHGLFAFAVRRRWTKANPVALVDRPPATRQHARRIRFLQPVEVEALLRGVSDDLLGPTDAALYLCAVTTGQGAFGDPRRSTEVRGRGRGGPCDLPGDHCIGNAGIGRPCRRASRARRLQTYAQACRGSVSTVRARFAARARRGKRDRRIGLH